MEIKHAGLIKELNEIASDLEDIDSTLGEVSFLTNYDAYESQKMVQSNVDKIDRIIEHLENDRY